VRSAEVEKGLVQASAALEKLCAQAVQVGGLVAT
jgi:hypothetical protein